jgi:hypothetical protein
VFSTGSSGSGGEVDPAGNQSGNKSDLLDDEEDFFDFISRNSFISTNTVVQFLWISGIRITLGKVRM